MSDDSVAALLSNRRYALFLASRVSLIVATQMLSVAVGWQIYQATHRPLSLGLSGLAIFVPGFLLALPAGHLADRHDRRTILAFCHVAIALAALVLVGITWMRPRSLLPTYGTLACLGAIRAFSGPAGQAFMPSLVSSAALARAVALASSAWQLAMIAGPSLGGVLYAALGGGAGVYLTSATLALIAAGCVLAIKPNHAARPHASLTAQPWHDVHSEDASVRTTTKREHAAPDTLLAGIRYVASNKMMLGAMTLDLAAVLLGGSVALLPVFAHDFLHVGPSGLGVLRSAPAFGAAFVALVLARAPLRARAGLTMLGGVFVFGLATVVFGLSRSFPLSVMALFILGGADMVSVVVRSTLLQKRTPMAMRGRVAAVNLVFIGASNELGELESGLVAEWVGPAAAVVVGGAGTCLVVVLWALGFPELARIDCIDDET